MIPHPPTSTDPPEDLRAVYNDDLLVMSFALPQGAKRVSLTSLEREVLASIVAGRSNAEIARERGRSLRTIVNQVSKILRKLGVASRLEIVAKTSHSA